MNEQELREMVRDSIARHASAGSIRLPLVPPSGFDPSHASFVRLPLLSGGDDDGACLIEPAVRCNHCGYCQSYGH